MEDFDGDGFLDIYVVKYAVQNNLWLTGPSGSVV
jgi:hypothetical protein